MVRRKYSSAKIFKSCTRKKLICKEVSVFLRASGSDRDNRRCEVRIHTLPTAYRNLNDNRCRSTGTASQKKRPCYEEYDAVLGDKPKTRPSHLTLSGESGSNVSIDDSDSDSFDDEVLLEDLMNATNIPISTS